MTNPIDPAAQSLSPLASLIDTYGPADAWLKRLITLAADGNRDLDMGKETETEAILGAVPRFTVSVMAIWKGLSTAERSLVVGFSPRQIPVLLAVTHELSEVYERYESQSAGGGMSRTRRRAEARAAFSAGRSFRDQVLRALKNIIPNDSPETAKIGRIESDARDEVRLAVGLRALSLALEGLHKTADTDTMTYYREIGLGAPTLAHLNELAEEVVLTARAAAELNSGQRVTQLDLDTQDGKVLHVVGLIDSAFRAARSKLPGLLMPDLGELARVFEGRSASSSIAPSAPA